MALCMRTYLQERDGEARLKSKTEKASLCRSHSSALERKGSLDGAQSVTKARSPRLFSSA
jgi:hypothetical protein